jgi:hypothetical protein
MTRGGQSTVVGGDKNIKRGVREIWVVGKGRTRNQKTPGKLGEGGVN